MSSKENLNLTRREFFKLAGLGTVGLILGGCKNLKEEAIEPIPSATPTESPMPTATELPEATSTESAQTPEPENTVATENVISKKGFELRGIPEEISSGHQVLVAEGEFTNTIGLGTESWLAEPGVALVGPDFDNKIIQESDGHIEYINPTNQQVFEGPEAYYNVPEGGFMIASGASMEITLGNRTIVLEGQERHNWSAVVRGLFADGKQDSDRNSTAHFTNYVPGHTMAMRYPQGAFVSEGQFEQIVENVHENGTNCGAEGCSRVSVIFVDLNTEAVTVITQEQGKGWQPLFSNWQK